MSKIEEGKKEEIIKDSVVKIIKGSEAVALQAVDSAASVLRVGLANAEDLGVKVSDILLNTTRRTINAGSIVRNDICDATKSMVKGTLHAASEIGSELKGLTSSPPAGKPEEQAKSE